MPVTIREVRDTPDVAHLAFHQSFITAVNKTTGMSLIGLVFRAPEIDETVTLIRPAISRSASLFHLVRLETA